MIEGGAVLITGALAIGAVAAVRGRGSNREQEMYLEEARMRAEMKMWIQSAVNKSRGTVSTSELVRTFNKQFPSRQKFFNEIIREYI